LLKIALTSWCSSTCADFSEFVGPDAARCRVGSDDARGQTCHGVLVDSVQAGAAGAGERHQLGAVADADVFGEQYAQHCQRSDGQPRVGQALSVHGPVRTADFHQYFPQHHVEGRDVVDVALLVRYGSVPPAAHLGRHARAADVEYLLRGALRPGLHAQQPLRPAAHRRGARAHFQQLAEAHFGLHLGRSQPSTVYEEVILILSVISVVLFIYILFTLISSTSLFLYSIAQAEG
jgi:hypothetical protein